MKITAKQYAQSLYESLKEKSETEIKLTIHNFVSVLAKNNNLKLSSEIMAAFREIWDEEEGQLNVELTSARTLDKKSKEIILDYLKERLSVSQINLTEKIAPSLMGGFILRYGSRIIDGSLKNNLFKLRNKISN